MNAPPTPRLSTPPLSPLRRSARCWLKRLATAIGCLILLYLGFVLSGFVPVNRGGDIPTADDRVRLFVRSNEIHTDIVMPVHHERLGIDWRETFPPEHFWGDVRSANYVAVGWGDRGFFVETPRWSDLKLSTALYALFWPSEAVLHVEYLAEPVPGERMHEVYVSSDQYARLVEFMQASIGARDNRGAAVTATDVTYGTWDRFYVASSRYHAFNTCNQWTGRGLKRAGVPVGIWTPLKQQVLLWLPEVEPSP
jgi:uncharacterized protein (TIGR02117 family)